MLSLENQCLNANIHNEFRQNRLVSYVFSYHIGRTSPVTYFWWSRNGELLGPKKSHDAHPYSSTSVSSHFGLQGPHSCMSTDFHRLTICSPFLTPPHTESGSPSGALSFKPTANSLLSFQQDQLHLPSTGFLVAPEHLEFSSSTFLFLTATLLSQSPFKNWSPPNRFLNPFKNTVRAPFYGSSPLLCAFFVCHCSSELLRVSK